MIRSVVGWSLNFRLLVVPVAALLFALGVVQLRAMPVDVLPEFTPPYVEIQTEALGLSASEVEQLLTVPLERDLLSGVMGIDVIRSESILGLSSVTLVFEPGTDLLDARQLVQERLLNSRLLPNVSKPPAMLQPLSSQSRVMMLGLSSKNLSLTEIGVLARWTIRPRLMGVPGVANVVIWGQREHELHVLVDPERLGRRGISMQQVVETTGNAQLVSPLSFLEASTPGSGGFIDTANQRLQVRHILPIAAPEGLAQVPLQAANGEPGPRLNGAPMRLGDVTDILVDHQPLIGDAVVNDGEGLYLVIEKFPGANTAEVTREVEEALDALRPGLTGLEVSDAVFRPASFIESARDNLTIAFAVSALLLLAVFLALFFHWRTALVAFVTIPLSLGVAVLVLALLGETMNALVLAGLLLAVGVIVDDAVAGVENVGRRLRQRPDGSAAQIVAEATLEMRRPAAYGTLLTLVAVLPVFFVPGRPGGFFEPLALSYALAVLTSMVVALTVGPALALMLLSRAAGGSRRDGVLLRRLTPSYAGVLGRTLSRPRGVLLAAGVAALAALALTPLLGGDLVPSFKERDVLVQLDMAPGTSRPEMARMTGRITREIRSIPGVRDVGAHVGRAVLGDRIVGTSAGAVWVSLREDADYDATIARVREVVNAYPGVGSELVSYSEERIRTVGALHSGTLAAGAADDSLKALNGSGEPVVVRIYGNDLEVIREKAREVRTLLEDIDGIVDPRLEEEIAEPTIEVVPNLAAARRHGIKPGDIRRAAATLVQGIAVGALFEEQKVFDVIVTGVPGVRHSPNSVANLLIDKPDGGRVRLADVADVAVRPSPVVIRREGVSRRLDVMAGVEGRGLGDVLDDVEVAVAQIDFPVEYHAEVLDDSLVQQATERRLLILALAALIAIYLLLQAALGSWRLAGVFLLALPLALAGGIVAALVAGGDLTLGAAAGLLTVLGIAVRNGLTLVSHCQLLRRDGEPFGPGLVRRAAQERLAPVAITAAGTLFALAPLLLPGDFAGYEIVHPMAIVVLGGLVTATIFTLFVVPALYLLFGSTADLAAEEELMGDLMRRASSASAGEPAPAGASLTGPTGVSRSS